MHAAELFVSPEGNDNNPGTQENPFQSISRAAEQVNPGDTVVIMPGIYRETVRPRISGAAENPITFKAAKKNSVTITGCDPALNWKKKQGAVYYADVTMELGHENQVFADGAMMWEARWPNAGGSDPSRLLEFRSAGMHKGTKDFTIVNSYIPDRDWTGASAWVSTHKRWYSWTGKITAFEKGRVSIVNNSEKAGNHVCKPKGRFYLFGSLAALDSENEWFYDQERKRLYVWMPGGKAPQESVEIKTRMYGFDLRGRTDIALRDLNLFGTSIRTDEKSERMRIEGGRLLYVYHSNRAEEQYRSQAETGIVLKGREHQIKNCEIAFSSGNGLCLAGDNCRIVNNYIHDCNYIGAYCAPLSFLSGTGHVVSHNTITRSGRSVINTASMHGSLLQYNDICFAGYLTDDLGLTYGNGVDGGNSELRYNWFHDNLCDHAQFGIYFDHGCRNLIIHHNLVWNVRDISMINNQYGNYIIYYHNTLVGAKGDRKQSYQSSWAAKMAEDLHGCRLHNNLGTAGTRVQGDNLVMSHNLWNVERSKLENDRIPLPDSGAIDSGIIIKGINDDYQGKAPDCGAYEAGGVIWKAGHDFSNPPKEINSDRSNAPHRNLLVNPDFYSEDFMGWEKAGDNIRIIFERHSQWQNTEKVVMRGYSIEFGKGENAVKQKIAGLIPGATYEVMGKFRAEKDAQARISVSDFGGKDKESKPISGNAPHWGKATIRFTVGPNSESAVVRFAKTSGGDGKVWFDDPGLQLVTEKKQ